MRSQWIKRAAIGVALVAAPAMATAQVRTIDPNEAIDRDLSGPPPAYSPPAQVEEQLDPLTPDERAAQPGMPAAAPVTPMSTAPLPPIAAEQTTVASETYAREDLMAAAEGVFGKGAAELAGLLEKILSEQGRPNAYIAGREAAGAFVVGVRYGSGVMTHKVEGQRPVYWTGPSIGFDAGGDATKVFVLVYNLYDSQELYRRFPSAEGRAYFIGGFAATYMRRGDVVLIPIRVGVGYRLGANIGYMSFSEKAEWLPF
ncbi:DUF1134 domain-containing protein [Sphingomonas sp. S1-29]|uniref:DUF1134 domain-containing protein n=1 Tax=Sphingomonas sp. S1-29 TaxID=2991074 RepID=UPI00223F622A|nr:DUF1134 domain-containing protein [Sphingomonas sp. S1-29]UZK70996.1 DUF1134 domain-containing protein [Sphingomonas sp. S1-29]